MARLVSFRAWPLLLAVMPVVLALAADPTTPPAEENPFRSARVGDWVEWKTTMQMAPHGGQPPIRSESHLKETVRSTDGKILEMQVQLMGQAEPVFIATQYALDRPLRPEWMGRTGKIELVSEAAEDREVGGKKLPCTKKEMRMTSEDGVATLIVHVHPDIPFGGIARMELKGPDGIVTIREALSFGRAVK